MNEKEMYILCRTIQAGMEDAVKDESAPGAMTTLKRIRKYAEEYEQTKQRVG